MNKNLELREYRKEYNLNIDGRNIPYQLVNVGNYLLAKNENWNIEDVLGFSGDNKEIYMMLNQIIAIKQSCVLLLNTSHSCQSLVDDLLILKKSLIEQLKDKYNYEFDEDLYESYPKGV